MPPRRRTLTEPDRAAWASYARQVRPLRGVAMPEPPPEAPAPVVSPSAVAAPATPVRSAARLAEITTGEAPAGLDAGTWNRLRSGRLAPVRTLDLHGRTAQAAFRALEHFLHQAAAERLRCVEVITGRGAGEQGGVIRRELPLWLNRPDLRPLVLATTHPHPANPGSTRILLRRQRPR